MAVPLTWSVVLTAASPGNSCPAFTVAKNVEKVVDENFAFVGLLVGTAVGSSVATVTFQILFLPQSAMYTLSVESDVI